MEFVRWAAARLPVYLISDTYTVRSHVIDQILRSDGLIDLFRERLYSDVIGVQKPSPEAVAHILTATGLPANALVHIGDLLDRDAEMARKAGCFCILLQDTDQGRAGAADLGEHVLATCPSFRDVQQVLVDYLDV